MRPQPFEQRAKFFQAELKRERAATRALQQAVDRANEERFTLRRRLIRTEEFLFAEGYRRLNLDGVWTKEPLPDD